MVGPIPDQSELQSPIYLKELVLYGANYSQDGIQSANPISIQCQSYANLRETIVLITKEQVYYRDWLKCLDGGWIGHKWRSQSKVICQLKVNHALTKIMPIQYHTFTSSETGTRSQSNANPMSIQFQSEANRWPSRRVTGNKCTMGTCRSVSTEDDSDHQFPIRRHSIWLSLTDSTIHWQSMTNLPI